MRGVFTKFSLGAYLDIVRECAAASEPMLTNEDLRIQFRTSLPTLLKMRAAAVDQKFIRFEGVGFTRRIVVLNDDGSDGPATAWRKTSPPRRPSSIALAQLKEGEGKGSAAHAPAARPALITIKSAAQAVGGMTLAEVRLDGDLWSHVRAAARDAGQSPSAFLQSIIPLALDRWRGEQGRKET